MRPQPPPPSAAAQPNDHHHQPHPLDPKIWRACAGTSVQIPTVNSRVYYFPQGHFYQASSPPEYFTPLLRSTPYVLCRIAAVQFLADPLTDEVFAKLLLHPLNSSSSVHHPPPPSGGHSGEVENNDVVVSFAKILTPSDANNGGGFSVPRSCAESIFPLLNFQADPPVQNLSITDVHGVAWEFRHIFRGTPRRHLLTTGWSKFVNYKKLIAGDSVVFMKNSRGEMFVGIRRTVRFASRKKSGGGAAWCSDIDGVRNRAEEGRKKQEEKLTEGFSRNGKGKLSPEAVVEAAEAAVQGKPFEVVYYPSAGWSEFVVKAEIVEVAMTVTWSPGMRVKMAVEETEDPAKMSWYQGTVASVFVPESGDWRGSPWRMLQVAWDERDVLKNAKWVSPWQVEHVSAPPILHTGFPLPPAKRFRADQGSGVLTDGDGDPFFPMTGFTNSTMGHLNQTLLSYGTFPAGMQGARHDLFSAYNFSNLSSDNSRLCMGNSSGNNTVPRSNTLSTELNIGSSQSENLSPDSQSSLHSFGTEFVGTHNYNSTNRRSGSFQLFGATIQTTQPVESGLHGTGTGGMNNLLDDSLACSELLDRIDGIDGQCQRASTVGACYL